MTSQAETYAAVLESSIRSTEELGKVGALSALDVLLSFNGLPTPNGLYFF
jgi:hypothetical protein